MNDRQLLELAAQAAGIKIDKSPYNGGGHGNDGFDIIGNAVLDWRKGKRWNPLTDDGDALRLTVKLGIQINPDASRTERATAYRHDIGWIAEKHEDHTHPCGAVRKAIVRAAAAMANIEVTRED